VGGHHPGRSRPRGSAVAAVDRGATPGGRDTAAAYANLLIGSPWYDSINHYKIAKKGREAAEAAGDVLGAIGGRATLSAQAMLTEQDADEALDQAHRALSEARQLGQPTLEAAALYVSGLAPSNARLYFSQTDLDQVREIQRTILGRTSGGDADQLASIMRGLPPLTCVLYSKQFPRFVRVTVNPYFARAS
jgi:hypothetical protein